MAAGGPADVGLHGFELPCPVKTGSDLRGMMDMVLDRNSDLHSCRGQLLVVDSTHFPETGSLLTEGQGRGYSIF